MKNAKDMKGTLYLICAAFIWGFALVAQKAGMTYMDVFGFTSVRCLLGGVSMLPLVVYRAKKARGEAASVSFPEAGSVGKSPASGISQSATAKDYILGSLECGIFLLGIMLFQQFGLPHTTVGKAAFITALYIPLTPLIQIFFGKKTPRTVWLGGGVTLIGLYLLCFTDGLSGFGFGDLCMLGAALAAALQMIAVEKWVQRLDGVTLSCFQFLVVGIICLPFALASGNLTLDAIQKTLIPILYAGLCSCGLGYTFQVLGQKYTTAAKAAILLSLETVFSLLAGLIFYRELLSAVEYAGCFVMFLGVLLSQRTPKEPK